MSYELLAQFGRRLRWGMVGGGTDSLIGETHRLAARTDNRFELVAGCLSIDPTIAAASARLCLLPEERSYADFNAMAEAEAGRDDGVEVVTICTPPNLHAKASAAFLAAGIDVICEKPFTRDLGEALQLRDVVARSGRKLALTHCYTGYPMVREARGLIAAGAIGTVRQVECDFVNGPFLEENPDRRRRHWRFLPEYMGRTSILGETGTHAFNLISFVTGMTPARLTASMTTLTAGRETFDDAQILLEFEGRRLGRMWLSFVATGNEHGLSFRIHGDQGSLKWHQERPETLLLAPRGEATRVLTPGHLERMTPEGAHACRLREGHPEGYVLAFANLYRDFGDQLIAARLGREPDRRHLLVPSVEDGVDTMRFFDAATRSVERNGTWEDL